MSSANSGITPISPDFLKAQLENEENTKRTLITPVLEERWPGKDRIVMEFFTDGRITVDEYGSAHRGKPKKVDYLLLYYQNIPLALVEAKGKDHTADEGYAQAIEYAGILDVPFAYATNGVDLIEKDMVSGLNREMKMIDFPDDILNVNGGAIALGHPFCATGAILTTKMVYELRRRDAHLGLITFCIGGGQGFSAVLERV